MYCCLITQLCLTFWNPMGWSTPGFLVLHHLPEFAQTHVHWVHDAIQPFILWCPFLLLPQSFPASKYFPMSWLCIRWPKYWSFSFSVSLSSEYSGLISFRIDWFDLLAVQGTLKSSPAPQFKSINSLALKLLYGPTLTSVHDHCKNHSLDYMDFGQQNNVSAFLICFLGLS